MILHKLNQKFWSPQIYECMFLFLGNVLDQCSPAQALVIVQQLPHLLDFIIRNMSCAEWAGVEEEKNRVQYEGAKLIIKVIEKRVWGSEWDEEYYTEVIKQVIGYGLIEAISEVWWEREKTDRQCKNYLKH